MAKRNDQLRGAIQAVAVAVVVGLLSGAVKLYTDVQELKLKFEYVNGRWDAPK